MNQLVLQILLIVILQSCGTVEEFQPTPIQLEQDFPLWPHKKRPPKEALCLTYKVTIWQIV